MQTFLPYQDFSKSASVLDDKRLNNQINEALIILRTLTGWYAKNGGKGWPNHPCTKMWQDNKLALCDYILACLQEYYHRNVDNKKVHQGIINRTQYLKELTESIPGDDNELITFPEWLTEDFCAEHRRILLEKDFAFYSKKFDALELEGYNVLA